MSRSKSLPSWRTGLPNPRYADGQRAPTRVAWLVNNNGPGRRKDIDMGWWKSPRGTIGDSAADVIDCALHKLVDVYLLEVGRLPTQGEVADVISFCSSGQLAIRCGDDAYTFDILGCDAVPCAEERGLRGALGPGARPPRGKLANIDPCTGTHYDAPTKNGESQKG